MKNIFVIAIILLISACGNQSIRPDKRDYPGLEQAQNYYQTGDFSNSARAYVQLFNSYREDEFAIYAADSFLNLADYIEVEYYLSRVNNTQLPLFKLLQAELSINNNNYDIYLDNIDGEFRPRYLAIQAKLYNYQQNYLAAALALIEITSLDTLASVNYDIIYNLMQVPEQELTLELFNLSISEVQQGWLEAAVIAFEQDTDTIEQWQNRWQDHPARLMFNQLNGYENIAVLLPLSGRYKNIAKSIQQGMLAALYRNFSKQQLTFFDTGSNGESFSYAWYGAIESGAEFIIGPLEKNSILQLVQINSATVPVLLLNNLEDEANLHGVYQFSLSKQDEVKSVASRLMVENKKRIMLLAPETNSGRELAKYFEEQYNYIGGQIVSYAFYPEATHDYSQELKQALGLNDSKIRARNLQSIIEEKIINIPQIRPDIDAIFVLARPKNARLIKPQLKFFQAETVPVYATSQIQSSTIDVELDKDLNGIKFCQNAFTINPSSLQNMLNFDTTKIQGNNKFFAFGYDAISIYPRLEWMQIMHSQSAEGLSGKLTVDSNGKIHRQLAWAQYQHGIPVLLPPIEPEAMAENDILNH